MGTESSSEERSAERDSYHGNKHYATELVGMRRKQANQFISDNAVYWKKTGERVTKIRASEKDGRIFEFSKVHIPGMLNVEIINRRIKRVIRMG